MTTALLIAGLLAVVGALWYAYAQGKKTGALESLRLAREAERDAERARAQRDQALARVDDDDLDRRLRLHERP